MLAGVALHFDPPPRHEAIRAVPGTLRALAAAVALFGAGGFGLTHLLLPAPLRRYELLWVLPVGGCAVGLEMTLLGLAGVPYHASLVLVLLAGVALAAHAVRRRGWPAPPSRSLAWPAYLALVVVAVALVPMVSELHYLSVTGTGADAHMAAGTANFLKHSYPLGVDVSQPINRMPPLWGSKFPIYYAFAGVSSLSGLDTWQVLAPLAAALLALAAVGFFVVARELFGASPAVAAAAMGLAGLDRMALHTGLNPYFNQTWGYLAMPFTLVLGWWAVQPGLSRQTRQGTVALLVVFGLVLVFAYPLAAPIPIVPIAAFAFSERRRRIARGERVFRIRDLYRGRRSLVWIVPVCALLTIPALAALSKALGAAAVLAPGNSLQAWGGDLRAFIPFNYFLSLPDSGLGYVLGGGVALLALRGLAGQPKALAWGMGALLAAGVLIAVYLRQRQYGYYFHFKLLAFIGPMLLTIAAVGAGRASRTGIAAVGEGLSRWGVVVLIALGVATASSAYAELKATGLQLGNPTIELGHWTAGLPKRASVRLDMPSGLEFWAAYFLASRPLCSREPPLGTDYPHVPISRKADYIVATLDRGRPSGAIGPALRANLGYRLYRENPSVPGADRCSQRSQSRLLPGADHGPG